MAAIGTRLMQITVDSTDYTAQCSAVTVESAESDSDFTSFADAAGGGARDYVLNFTAVQDAETGSMWDEIYTNTGDEVDVVLKPYGNASATATQPHFTVTATITEPDGVILGGEANASTSAKMTIEGSWPCTRPVKKTTA